MVGGILNVSANEIRAILPERETVTKNVPTNGGTYYHTATCDVYYNGDRVDRISHRTYASCQTGFSYNQSYCRWVAVSNGWRSEGAGLIFNNSVSYYGNSTITFLP